jgi:hypothetical protein
MEKLFTAVLKPFLFGLPPVVVLIIILLFFPEKIEKWSALLWKMLSLLGKIFGFAKKRYIKHDLQGRVNDFVRRLRKKTPGSFNDRLELEWVDSGTKRSAFLADGRVVLRLRADDPNDYNFVHASYFYISKCLLSKTKRYLSTPQKDAIDLFTSSKLIKEEKPSVIEYFLDEYLHPSTSDPNSKQAKLIDDFAVIDKAGYYFPLFIQELEYIGDKIFGKKRDQMIVNEVYRLVDFLRPLSERRIGDETELNFNGNYCKIAIVIVGKPAKLLTSLDPYIFFINKNIIPNKFDTIYILGRKENKSKLEELCSKFSEKYECVRNLTTETSFRFDDHTELALQYLIILRRKGAELIVPSNGFTQQQH